VPVMLRTNAEDDVLCGRPIRRGSTVVVAPWIVHRHRRLWRDPDNFDPERFAPKAIAARSRYAFLPFAVGPRTCIAAPLAMMQLHVAVAILAQRFRFRLVAGHAVEPAGWTTLRPNGHISLHPQGGLQVTVARRAAASPEPREPALRAH